jgi:hypothetical protein
MADRFAGAGIPALKPFPLIVQQGTKTIEYRRHGGRFTVAGSLPRPIRVAVFL